MRVVKSEYASFCFYHWSADVQGMKIISQRRRGRGGAEIREEYLAESLGNP